MSLECSLEVSPPDGGISLNAAVHFKGLPLANAARHGSSRLLRIPDSRRLRYFGFVPANNEIAKLNGWLRASSSIRQRRGSCMQNILDKMELIRLRIALRPLFRDWCLYTLLLQKHRLVLQKRSYVHWKTLYYAIKYRILDSLVSRMHVSLLRTRFLTWVDETVWLRAKALDERQCKRRHMYCWIDYVASLRLGRLLSFFCAWRERTRIEALCRKLMNQLIANRLRRYLLYWRLRQREEHLIRLLRLRLMRKCFQLLLVTRAAVTATRSPSPDPIPQPKPIEMDYNCTCIAKIVRGGHCDCRKDVHFRRRLAYCFQEVETFLDDRQRITQSLRVSHTSTPYPTSSGAPRRPTSRRVGQVESAQKQVRRVRLDTNEPRPDFVRRDQAATPAQVKSSMRDSSAKRGAMTSITTPLRGDPRVVSASKVNASKKRLFESPVPIAPPSRSYSPPQQPPPPIAPPPLSSPASPQRTATSPSPLRSPVRSSTADRRLYASPPRASRSTPVPQTPRLSLDRLHFNESVEHGPRVSMTHWNTHQIKADPPSLEPYQDLEV